MGKGPGAGGSRGQNQVWLGVWGKDPGGGKFSWALFRGQDSLMSPGVMYCAKGVRMAEGRMELKVVHTDLLYKPLGGPRASLSPLQAASSQFYGVCAIPLLLQREYRCR